ncbi:hypothetical protein GOBAR_AA35547 [Gossypium barbadense]|uniref:Uncharacterized protein n=1 Tax=Gossypium barbadense TaxID=3634 RepID=A0A2P5W227_GOSBA|nr:hypothetical protein GOBAR_AA35547 [Gossypium barbadense]
MDGMWQVRIGIWSGNAKNIGQIDVEGIDWSTLFPIICRCLWKCRNAFVFKDASNSNGEVVSLVYLGLKVQLT